MDDYTMQQYYRGLISPEMRAYIEEEMSTFFPIFRSLAVADK